jgi:hypothetical protein
MPMSAEAQALAGPTVTFVTPNHFKLRGLSTFLDRETQEARVRMQMRPAQARQRTRSAGYLTVRAGDVETVYEIVVGGDNRPRLAVDNVIDHAAAVASGS